MLKDVEGDLKMIPLQLLTKITKERIDTLHDSFKPIVIAWAESVRQAGVIPYIYCGFRTPEEQEALYAKGRTTKGSIVTKARAWQSFHNYGMAIDWVPAIKDDKTGLYEAGWGSLKQYKIGQDLALKHGMRFLSWERPHLENAKFKNWSELFEQFRKNIEAPKLPEKVAFKSTRIVPAKPSKLKQSLARKR